MRRLANTPELLDGDLDPLLLAGNLRDMARVNRWLGGAELSWRALRSHFSAEAPLSLLDVGTGGGDIPVHMYRRSQEQGVRLELAARDIRPEIIAIARRAIADLPIAMSVDSDLEIGTDDASFDIVHSSMVLHHLEPDAAVKLLREMARVARRLVIVNDLARGWHWWLGAWLLSHTLTGNAYTRHDAPLSVRRAYTPGELIALGLRAGLQPRSERRTLPGYRYALTFSHAGR